MTIVLLRGTFLALPFALGRGDERRRRGWRRDLITKDGAFEVVRGVLCAEPILPLASRRRSVVFVGMVSVRM
jgi:hypothetical protein